MRIIRQETPFVASIPLPDVLTVVYVLVDDWYQTHPLHPDRMPPGRKPALSVSETVTILLAMDMVPFPSERGFLGAGGPIIRPCCRRSANSTAMPGPCAGCLNRFGKPGLPTGRLRMNAT